MNQGLSAQRFSVAVIDYSPGNGGGQQLCLDMIHGLIAQGYQVHACVASNSFLSEKLNALSCTIQKRTVPEYRQGFVARLKRTWCTLSNLWKDRLVWRDLPVCVVNDPDAFLPAAVIATLARQRNLILYAHLIYRPGQRAWVRAVSTLSSVRQLWCVSSYLAQHVGAVGSGDKRRVLPSGSRFSLDDRIDPRRLKKNRVASIGLLHPNKGHHVMRLAAERFSHAQFHVLGSAAAGQDTYVKTLKHGAPSNLYFPGHVTDVKRYLEDHEIGVLVAASLPAQEAFGLTAIEGAFLGLKVVVRDTAGLAEIASRLSLAKASDDEGILQIVQQVIESENTTPESLDSKALTFFSSTAYWQRLSALINELAAEHPGSRGVNHAS